MLRVSFVVLALLLVGQSAPEQPKRLDFNVAVMDATFRIFGPNGPNSLSTGTGFLMGKPIPGRPEYVHFVLVTAAHVLSGIHGERATLVLRVRNAAGRYERREHPMRIRNGPRPIWTQHPTSDVAVMYVDLPDRLAAIPIPLEFLASDADFEKLELHPGDNVLAVGYPYGFEGNVLGFPILRSGRIASHPLTPAVEIQKLLVDFNVFGGNSGGPVYLNDTSRLIGNSMRLGGAFTKIVGLVSDQTVMRGTNERLGVAGVVPGQFIIDTIARLPARPAR